MTNFFILLHLHIVVTKTNYFWKQFQVACMTSFGQLVLYQSNILLEIREKKDQIDFLIWKYKVLQSFMSPENQEKFRINICIWQKHTVVVYFTLFCTF